jgi:hypothetical protein
MAEIRTLMRELALEKLRAGEVLGMRIIDPTLAHPFVGQIVDALVQKGVARLRDLAIKFDSILRASCTSLCFILMIWSSLARNRSLSPSSSVSVR